MTDAPEGRPGSDSPERSDGTTHADSRRRRRFVAAAVVVLGLVVGPEASRFVEETPANGFVDIERGATAVRPWQPTTQ